MNEPMQELKGWTTIRAKLALHRVQAFRSDGVDGPRTYFTIFNGATKAYPDLAALRSLLEELGETA